MSVCVLERGKAYPPGSFPRSPWEMARNFWDPSEGLHGLFDVWSFRGLGGIVAMQVSLLKLNAGISRAVTTAPSTPATTPPAAWPSSRTSACR